MKKTSILVLLCVLVLVFSLVGCQIKDDIASNQEEIAQLREELTKLGTDVDSVNSTLSAKIDEKIDTINKSLAGVNKSLDSKLTAQVQSLSTKIDDADAALDAKLTKALADAQAALEKADAANKTKLEADLADAQAALEAADAANKTKLEADLADAQAALVKADADNKAELNAAIGAVNDALTNAKTALEKADTDNKAELNAAINAVSDALDAAVAALNGKDADLTAAIAALSTALDDAKAALDAKDADLEEAIGELEEAVVALQEKDVELGNSIADLEAAVAELQAKDVELDAAIAAVSDALDAAKDALDAKDEELDDAIAALNDALTNAQTLLNAKDAELESDLADLAADFNAAVEDIYETLATKAALQEAIDALNAKDADLQDAIDALTALEAADKAELTTKINDDINAAKTELNTAINARVLKTEFDTTVEAVYAAIAQALSDANDYTDAAAEDLQGQIDTINDDIDGINTAIEGINDAIEGINGDIEGINGDIADINEAIEGINAVIANIQENIIPTLATKAELVTAQTALEDADEAINLRIDAAEALVATVQETLVAADEDLQGQIDDLSADLNDVKTAYATLVYLGEQVNILKGETFVVEAGVSDLQGLSARVNTLEGSVATAQADIIALQNRFTAFNGEVVRGQKEMLVNELVMAYANFDETMTEARAIARTRLIGEAMMDPGDADDVLNVIFESIRKSWTHVMLGYLHRGTTLITLSEDNEQAIAYKVEYVNRINSYINLVQFKVDKEVIKYVITNTHNDLPGAVKTSILAEVEAVEYDQSAADAMPTMEEVNAYFKAQDDTLYLWLYRSAGINEIYAYLATKDAEIVALGTAYITAAEQTQLLSDLEDVIDVDAYKAIEAAYDELNNIVATNVATKVTADKAAMDLIVAQATAYNETCVYAQTKKAIIDGAGLLTVDLANEIKASIDACVDDLADFRALETADEVAALEQANKDAIDVIMVYFGYYYAAVEYAKDCKDAVDAIAAGITDGEKTTVKGLIDACVTAYATYLTKEITETVENEDEAIDLRNSDMAKMDVYYDAASTYAADVVYKNGIIAEINNTTTGLTYIQGTGEIDDVNDAINAVLVLSDYTACATIPAVGEVSTANKDAIDLYEAQAEAFDALLAFEAAKLAEVDTTALTYLTVAQSNAAKTAISAISDFDNYFDALEDQDAIDEQYAADTAAMTLVVAQASKYNALVSYTVGQKAHIDTLTGLKAGQKATVKAAIEAVLDYDRYLGNADYVANDLEDRDAIDLYVAQMDAYQEVKDEEVAVVATISGLTFDDPADMATAIGYAQSIPVFANYFEVLADLAAINGQKDNDIAALDLIEDQCTAFSNATVYKNTKKGEAALLGNFVAEDITDFNDALDAIMDIDNYLGNVAYADQETADKAKADVLKYKAVKYNAAKGYAATKIAGFGTTYDAAEYVGEKTLVVDRINAVVNATKRTAYIGAIEDIPNGLSVNQVVDAMLAADQVKIDVLGQRLATYKAVYDEKVTKDAYVDTLGSLHACADPDHCVITPADRVNFKNLYKGFVEDFDANADVLNWQVVTDVTGYETYVVNMMTLAKKSIDTYNKVLDYCGDNEDNMVVSMPSLDAIDASTSGIFKARFNVKANSAAHIADTSALLTEAAYDTYYSNYETLVNETIYIAGRENYIVAAVLAQKATNTAAISGSFTAAKAAYLNDVCDDIYATRTNKAVTATGIAWDNQTGAAAELSSVNDGISLLTNIEMKKSIVNAKVALYVANDFRTAFYTGREDDEYHIADIVWNKFYDNTAYSAETLALCETQPSLTDTISSKAAEFTYSYEIPTEHTYVKYAAFKSLLTGDLTAMDTYELTLKKWCETDYDGDDVDDDGVLRVMIDEYNRLDAAFVVKAIADYTNETDGKLLLKKNAYVTAYPGLSGTFTSIFNFYRINIEAESKTSTVVAFYNTACTEMARAMYKDKLATCFEDNKAAAITNGKLAEYTDLYNIFVGMLNGYASESVIIERYAGYTNMLYTGTGFEQMLYNFANNL